MKLLLIILYHKDNMHIISKTIIQEPNQPFENGQEAIHQSTKIYRIDKQLKS